PARQGVISPYRTYGLDDMKTFVLFAALFSATSVFAQTPDGAQVFQGNCASCHTGAADSRAPAPDALKARTPQAIIDALMTGAMRPQGSRLSGPERRAVAEFLTGKRIDGDVTGAVRGRCTAASTTSAIRDVGTAPHWSGWSPTPTNA